MRPIIFKTFILIFTISVLILPVFAHSYTLLEPLPKIGGGVLTKDVGLTDYLNWIFRFTLAATGFLAVLMIVIGGVEFMISGANESSRGDAKKRISGALWGLLLAFGAWLIVYTINPELVKLNFALPDAKIQMTGENSEVKDSRVDKTTTPTTSPTDKKTTTPTTSTTNTTNTTVTPTTTNTPPSSNNNQQ